MIRSENVDSSGVADVVVVIVELVMKVEVVATAVADVEMLLDPDVEMVVSVDALADNVGRGTDVENCTLLDPDVEAVVSVDALAEDVGRETDAEDCSLLEVEILLVVVKIDTDPAVVESEDNVAALAVKETEVVIDDTVVVEVRVEDPVAVEMGLLVDDIAVLEDIPDDSVVVDIISIVEVEL